MKLIEKKVDVGLEHERQVLTKNSNCHKFTLCWAPCLYIIGNVYLSCVFLAVQNSSIGDLVTNSLTDSLRVLLLLTLQSDPRDLRRLRHLIRVMKRHDLTEKDLPTNIPTQYTPTDLCTSISEHPKGAILETCDL